MKDSDLLCLAVIVQGLLASGEYTENNDSCGNGENEPAVRKWDGGKEWKDDGLLQRWNSYAVADAISLLRELKLKTTELE